MKYVLLLIVILGLFVASCAPAPVVTPVQTTPTPEPVVSAPVVVPVVAPVVLSDDARQLKESLSATVTYGVTYTYTYTSTSSNVRGTVVKYVDGSKSRYDSSIDGLNTQMYTLNGAYTLCTKSSMNWNCVKSDANSAKDNLISKTNADVIANIADYEVSRLPSEEIIGVDASCYHVITAKDVSVDYCFNANSVPYLIKSQKLLNGYPAITELRATTFVSTIPAEKFVPPQVVSG